MPAKTRKKSAPAPKPAPTLPPGVNALLTAKQVGAAIGGTERWVRRLIAEKEFPPHDVTVKGHPRWTVETFNSWVEARKGKV